MFDRNYNIERPAEEILNYLEANKVGCPSLRRRAVVYNSDGKWFLQACVVEGISIKREKVRLEDSRRYNNVILFEDWLLIDELPKFIEQIRQGGVALGEYLLEPSNANRQWTKELQPLSNDYMPYAGYVWASKFHEHSIALSGELLAPKQPYYPDLHEAVKDWLPFPIYHGSSDARKGEVILLLPETRAYLDDAIPHGNALDLHISGSEAGNLSLEVKGAWWDEDGIHHFSEKVSDGGALLHIPESAKRLDYVLVDTKGTVYDYQQEDGNRHTGLGRKSKTERDQTLANIVREARLNGEGKKVEFKPFIYPENDKLSEVIRTIAAFANAEGGRIFLGINNGCELVGIDEELQKWARAEANEESCEKYLGEIKGKIRDQLRVHVQLYFNQGVVDGVRIALIEVDEAKEKPVTTQQEKMLLYIRRGSSNTKTSPEEWATISSASGNGLLSPFGRWS